MSTKSHLGATSYGTGTDVSAEPAVCIFMVDDVQKVSGVSGSMLPPASGPEMSVTTYKQTRRHIPEDTNIISTARTISNLAIFPFSIVNRVDTNRAKTWKSF